MNRNRRVLLLTNCIPDYRIPVYNALGEYYDLTIAHYGKLGNMASLTVPWMLLHPYRVGPFTCFKESIIGLARQYDAILSLAELRILPYMALTFRKRHFALCYWSIGVTVSYSRKYDEVKRFDFLRTYLTGRADSLVFYSSYPIFKHLKYGVSWEKMFVANNTVAVGEKIDVASRKEYFLFVGTLYKAKKIFDLLEAYHQAFLQNNQLPGLIIVGDGTERTNVERWIETHHFFSRITLKGAVFEPALLREIYRKAIATISPGQAGLSVLSSMAYGVPFVTTRDAITGGEIFNIEDEVNGLFYDGTVKGLTRLMIRLAVSPGEVYMLGKNAQDYYFENRTVERMVEGIVRAVDYAIDIKQRDEKENLVGIRNPA